MLSRLLCALLATCTFAAAQNDRDFSGRWVFQPEQSELRALPHPPDQLVTIDQQGPVVRWLGPDAAGTVWTYNTDGTSTRRSEGGVSFSSQTKWEGSVLMINTIVSAPHDNYSITERWKLSRNLNTLTIERHIVRASGESQSTLVYTREGAPPKPVAVATLRTPEAPNAPAEYLVETGTHLPLRLLNSVSTKHSVPRDRVYLETIYPVLSHGRIVIPAGSYVMGSLTEVKRAGRVKGRSELYLRFDSLTLPNGATRDFRARMSGMDDASKGTLDRKEGRVEGESGKGNDVKTVATATAAGTSVGAIAGSAAGHIGMGAGIGAAAGAVGGLVGVLTTRGPDAVLERGATVEMVLDRNLTFTADELR
jgi:type IV secretion system protein VirB10